MKCFICSGKSEELFFYAKPVRGEIPLYEISSYPRIIYQCKSCYHCQEVLEQNPNDLYSGTYSHTTYGSVDEIHAKYQQIRSLPDNKSDNFSRVKNLVQWYEGQGSTSPGKILDVGCGLAVFTKSMQELGWNVSAIDLDKSFVTHAKQLGLNAKLTLLKDYPGDAFDLLTFNKVLEHVRYPDNLLHEGIRLLKGRGLIYLEVPDASASSMGKEREEFLSGHIHVFSIESISRLIRLLNLDLLKIKSVIEPSGKMTIRVLCGLTRKHL